MNSCRSSYNAICLTLLALSIPGWGLACESEPNVRDPRCAKHPPDVVGNYIRTRLQWRVYYHLPSRECVIFDGPTEGAIKAAGAKDLEDFEDRFTPFQSVEECLTVCHEPQPCDADNPCPPFEYTNGWPPHDTYPQTCVGASSEGGGHCALQCQSQGLDVKLEHFGWWAGAICPDGFTCTEEACVLAQP